VKVFTDGSPPYYFNKATKEVSWTLPQEAAPPASGPEGEGGSAETEDPAGPEEAPPPEPPESSPDVGGTRARQRGKNLSRG